MVLVLWLASTRAAVRGTNLSSLIASWTRWAVPPWTGVVPFRTRLTVAIDTPALRATSAIVGSWLFLGIDVSAF
jgi:hypothetical protein